MSDDLGLDLIDSLTGGRLGRHDVLCPFCGPVRRSPANQRRRVLRIWRIDPDFASYHCARCGEKGFARNPTGSTPDPAALERARVEAAARERDAAAERLSKARWLWSQRQPIAGSIAETYLREARGYGGALPGTFSFLPARGEHSPALIAAFGVPTEPEPGILHIRDKDLRGVHITRLAPDGRNKAHGTAKIMLGHSVGNPIVLAPANDLLGLAITEGIEDGLSVHEATGLAAWAAGSASRLPALAVAIPDYIESVTIMVDDDRDGRRHAGELDHLVKLRGIEVRSILLPQTERAAS